MLVRQIQLKPAPGNGRQVRQILEDNVRANPLGLAGSLSQDILGDIPTFILSSLFENMEAMEKHNEAAESNAEIMKGRADIEALLSGPVKISLNEVLVRSESSTGSGRFIHRVRFFPALGKREEVTALVEKFAGGQHDEGRVNVAVSRQLFSPTGAVISVRDTYETLAEYENVARQRRDAATTVISQAEAISRKPPSAELKQIILRYGG